MKETIENTSAALLAKAANTENKAIQKWCGRLNELILAAAEKKVSEEFLSSDMARINTELNVETSAKNLRKFYNLLVRKIMNEYGLVSPTYHQTQWMALGMTIFGLPLGVAFAMAIGNMAFLGIGLPLGIPIGMAIGQQKDKKAKEEGRVLNIQPLL